MVVVVAELDADWLLSLSLIRSLASERACFHTRGKVDGCDAADV